MCAIEEHDSIGIMGLGYVGLPLAIEFAKKRRVVGFDTDSERIDQLKKTTIEPERWKRML